METTKKTSTTKAALLVLAALSMLLSGLFIATASSSDAQGATCPAGFTLLAAAGYELLCWRRLRRNDDLVQTVAPLVRSKRRRHPVRC